jgi:hypothetical protein
MRKLFWGVVTVLVATLAPVGAASAASGPQTFVLYQGPNDDHFTVYAAGPISGVGTDILLDEGVDEAGRTQRHTETVFPQGSTFNTLTVLENNLAFDPRSCIARITGTSQLETTGGTGAYEGATGQGQVSFRALALFERTPEGCSRRPVAVYSVATVTGTASVPD